MIWQALLQQKRHQHLGGSKSADKKSRRDSDDTFLRGLGFEWLCVGWWKATTLGAAAHVCRLRWNFYCWSSFSSIPSGQTIQFLDLNLSMNYHSWNQQGPSKMMVGRLFSLFEWFLFKGYVEICVCVCILLYIHIIPWESSRPSKVGSPLGSPKFGFTWTFLCIDIPWDPKTYMFRGCYGKYAGF